MNRGKTSRLPEQILEEASTWFVEFTSGQVEQAAREEFIRWLRASPEHVRAYLQISAHWEDSRALEKSHKKSVDELVAIAGRESSNVIRLEASAADPRDSSRRPSRHRSRNTLRLKVLTGALVASLAIVMTSAAAWYYTQRNVYSTGIGEQRSIQLADGSTVELNARSRARVLFQDHEREVELIEGQALFHVAKDPARPFIVHAGEAQVRAVGTQFDVYRKRDGTVVTVIEGSVAVTSGGRLPPAEEKPVHGSNAFEAESQRHDGAPASAPSAQSTPSPGPRGAGSELLLTAGEQLALTSTSSEKAADADVVAATAWTRRQIIFKSTPLTEVVEEFNRYNRRQLVITDPNVAATRISGVFSSSDPAPLLLGLNDLGVFTLRETDERIEISGK